MSSKLSHPFGVLSVSVFMIFKSWCRSTRFWESICFCGVIPSRLGYSVAVRWRLCSRSLLFYFYSFLNTAPERVHVGDHAHWKSQVCCGKHVGSKTQWTLVSVALFQGSLTAPSHARCSKKDTSSSTKSIDCIARIIFCSSMTIQFSIAASFR